MREQKISAEKAAQSEMIKRQTEEFLARGGEIKRDEVSRGAKDLFNPRFAKLHLDWLSSGRVQTHEEYAERVNTVLDLYNSVCLSKRRLVSYVNAAPIIMREMRDKELQHIPELTILKYLSKHAARKRAKSAVEALALGAAECRE